MKSMMVLYDKLFQTSGSGDISLHEYIPVLLEEIIENFANSHRVQVETEIQAIVMNAITLQPLGIILNELTTNVMKYAFRERNNGRIFISAKKSGSVVQIVVQDDGIGQPEYIDFDKSTGFGLQLVQALTLQLKGEIRIERGTGTRFILEFEL